MKRCFLSRYAGSGRSHSEKPQMTATALIRQRLKNLVEGLPETALSSAETLLIALNQGLITATNPSSSAVPEPALSEEERLIGIIQQRLPEASQNRLESLRKRLAEETITKTEHQELIEFVEQVELRDVQRAEAMVQLAQLREVELGVIVESSQIFA